MFVSQKNNAYGLNLQLMLLKTIAINVVTDHNVVIWGTTMGWQFMFTGRVRVVSNHEYSTTWVDPNSTCLVNVSGIFNPNMTRLLNRSTRPTRLIRLINNSYKGQYK